MGKVILIIIGLLIAMHGVIMVFDARLLTKKFFGFGDQNEATAGFKIIGFFVAIIGGLIIFFNIWYKVYKLFDNLLFYSNNKCRGRSYACPKASIILNN